MTTDSPLLVVIAGPTAVGKTGFSIELAKHFSTEILSADSRQFYREMKIGTAAPSPEELAAVPHHFIGHLGIQDPYNVSRFEQDALNLLEELFRRHPVVVLTGGSGLYIQALCSGIDDLPDPDESLRESLKERLEQEGIGSLQSELERLDPVYAAQVDRNNPKRLLRALEVCIATGRPYSELRTNAPKSRPFRILKIGLYREREELNDIINRRVDRMMEQGLEEEARRLWPFHGLNALNTVGYKELFAYFEGRISPRQAVTDIKTHSRRYAKRQMTWFRKDPEIRWIRPEEGEKVVEMIGRI